MLNFQFLESSTYSLSPHSPIHAIFTVCNTLSSPLCLHNSFFSSLTLNITSSTKVRTCIRLNKANFTHTQTLSSWPPDQSLGLGHCYQTFEQEQDRSLWVVPFFISVCMCVRIMSTHGLGKHCWNVCPLGWVWLLAWLHLVHSYPWLSLWTEAPQLWEQISSRGTGPEPWTLLLI